MTAPLLTKRDLAALPRLYATDGQGLNATARVRLFLPGTGFAWYLTELDPDSGVAFALSVCRYVERGYVHVPELAAARGPYGARVERDRHWRPRPLAECLEDEGRSECESY